IDLHHGSISAQSREATPVIAGFTKFTIILPSGNTHFDKTRIIEDTTHEDYALENQVLGGSVAESFEGTSVKKSETADKPLILLVEDNEEIRVYLRDILQQYYDVLESPNGLEGLAVAVERLPDLIISDVMMPKVTGLEWVTKLKSDQRSSHIPIMLLTARGTLNHQVEGLQTRADDYLIKPFNIQL